MYCPNAAKPRPPFQQSRHMCVHFLCSCPSSLLVWVPCLDKPALVGDAQAPKVTKDCRTPAHTSPQAQLSRQGTGTKYAGKSQHALEVLTAHQGHQELWNRSPCQPCASQLPVLGNCTCLPSTIEAQPCNVTFLTIKTVVRKIKKDDA